MMKKLFLRIAMATVGIAGLGIATQAQAVDRIVVSVPFEFVVAGTTLPAGTYRVHRLHDDPSAGLVLTSYQNRVTIAVLPIDVERARANKPELAFETAGHEHILSRIRTDENIFDIPVSKSKKTGVLANNAKPSLGGFGGK
jgi:hypothetical protein